MIINDYYRFLAIISIITFSALGEFFEVPCYFQIFLHSIALIYLGSLYSTKIYDVTLERHVETIDKKDAWFLPAWGSAFLFGVWLLIKYFGEKAENVNFVFKFYFAMLAVYTISTILYERLQNIKLFFELSKKEVFTIPKTDLNSEIKIDTLYVLTLSYAAFVAGLYWMYSEIWIWVNIIGVAFSLYLIQNIILGKYKNAFILMCVIYTYNLFFFVFGIDVINEISSKLKGPIYLNFINHDSPNGTQYETFGLGNIIIPGIYIAFILRYDISRSIKKFGGSLNIPLDYDNYKTFVWTLLGYGFCLALNLYLKEVFNYYYQPLNFLIPSILISSLACGYTYGEFESLWNYKELTTLKELNAYE